MVAENTLTRDNRLNDMHQQRPTMPLHVVILAAGMGSRMRSQTPKVLHQVAGTSLLGHVINASLTLQPSKLHIVVGHGKEQVIAAFAQHPQADRLHFVEQKSQLGTADAVKTAMPHIPSDARVLMLTADVPLINSDTLSQVCAQLKAHSLCVLTAVMQNPFGLGRILRSPDGQPTGIVEEKDATPAQHAIKEINAGIMAARYERLALWLDAVGNNNAQGEYYLTDIVGLAVEEGDPISTVQVSDADEVKGVNTRAQLAELERIWQRNNAERVMLQGVTLADPARFDVRGDVTIGADTFVDVNVVIEGPSQIGSGVHIAANSVIKQSTIADGVTVHEHSVIEGAQLEKGVNVGPFARLRPGTHLAEGVRIGNFVETKNAKFAAGAKANHLSYVGDASVGRNTNIGAGVITCNYDGANKHHTEIGNDVFVGSDSQLVAPVVIGDGATIGAGSTITSKVGEHQLAISRGKQREISGWQRPVKKDKK